MNLFAVSLRNLRVRGVSTTLTTVSIMVGTALLAALWLLIGETDKRYKASALGYGAIVGPKEGSPLALVLNTVYNLGVSPGVVPMSVYKELHDRRGMRYVIPQARGDTFGGFPVIGTTDEMFTKFRRGKLGGLEFAAGRAFAFDHAAFTGFVEDLAAGKVASAGHHEHADGELHADAGDARIVREAVIGAQVADRLDLGVGSSITPVHGGADDVDVHVHEESRCEVVGVLEATGTPLDGSIFIPLSVFLTMDKHEPLRPGQAATDDNVILSALIVDCVRALDETRLRWEFQTRADAQVAWTVIEIRDLLNMVGNATDVLRVVSWLVLVVAGVSICVALYNTMNERRREIAIMRALGARRRQILQLILQEALVIAAVGAALGVLVCHGAAWFLAGTVQQLTGVSIDWAAFSRDEIWLILGVCALGAVAGVLPAVKGSRTAVADNLAPTS